MNLGVQFNSDPFDSKNKKIWIVFFILAVLCHLLIFLVHVDWDSSLSPSPKMEVQEINPKKLESIRRQWKQKQLLLDKNPSKPNEAESSPDSRYFSDRNSHVEKEQRAAHTHVIPQRGTENGIGTEHLKKKSEPHHTKTGRSKLPNLSQLALPFELNGSPHSQSSSTSKDEGRSEINSTPKGGDQAIDDPDLPTGGENLLNTQESVFYSFYARIYEEIGQVWNKKLLELSHIRPIHPGEYDTVVEVTLDQEGNLIGIQRLQSSGVDAFDSVVDETFRKVGRFPNPPHGLLTRERQAHLKWKFRVTVGSGMNFDYLPPERLPY